MTVKAFSELGTRDPAYLQSGAAVERDFSNIIYNGDLDIWQRATSGITTLGYTGPDRFQFRGAYAGTFTSERITDTIPGIGRMSVAKVTYTATNTLNTRLVFAQPIPLREWQTIAGRTFTMSFWAKADTQMDIASEFAQNSVIGGLIGARDGGNEPSYAKLLTIGTTWQRYSHTAFAVNPETYVTSWDVSGAQWPVFLYLTAKYDATNPYAQARSSFLQDHGGVIYLTGFRLDVDVTSPREFRKLPSYDVELKRCQAFYQKTFSLGTAVAQGASADGALITPASANAPAGSVSVNWPFSTPMFKVPTVTTFTPTGAVSAAGGFASSSNEEIAATVVSTTETSAVIATNAVIPSGNRRLAIHAEANGELP